MEKLGHKYRLALKLSKDPRFEKLSCDHKGTYADDCIVNRVKQNRCFIVATCDKDLKRRIRKTLHEITHGFVDLVKDTAEATSAAMGNAYDKTAEGASIAADATSHALKEVFETTSEAASTVRKATAKASKRAYVKTVRAARNLSSSPKKSVTPVGEGVLTKADSSTIGATGGATKVAAKQAVVGTTTAKTTPAAVKRPSVKQVTATSKLASTAKKTTAPKARPTVSSGRALTRRAAT